MISLIEISRPKKHVWEMTKQEYESVCLWHGTHSPPFKKFKQSEATKGKRFWNPLGNGMYVTDKKEFAKNFGPNQYPVYIPQSANLTVRKIYKGQKDQIVESIVVRVLKKVGIHWFSTRYNKPEDVIDSQDRVEIYRTINSQQSAYDAMAEIGALFDIYAESENKNPKYKNITPEIFEEAANHFLGDRYDVVFFQETNDPQNYIIGHKSAKEIIIFNPKYQKITFHEELVKEAMDKGKAIPDRVLKDYPDLKNDKPKTI